MRYRITLEVDDPQDAMGDSPPLEDLRAWQHYLDVGDDVLRVVRVEIVDGD